MQQSKNRDFGPFFIEEEIMDIELKGYYVPSGYMGWTGEKYELFASEADYKEQMEG